MNLSNNHLSEERLIAAVLAEEDLSQEEINHLTLCPSCQALRDSIAADLIGLEELGRQTVQAPPRSFKLPAEEPQIKRETSRHRLFLGGSLALAAAALMAVWLGVWSPQPVRPPQTELTPPNATLPASPFYEDTDALTSLGIQEVETFSPFQQFVLGGDRETSSEQFMEFIMPEPGSNGRGKKGGAACLSVALPA